MNIAQILAPIFFCVAAGAVLGRTRTLRPEPFVSAVMDLFMPALVFDALVTADLALSDFYTMGLASAAIIAILLGFCLLTPLRPLRTFALPVLFMNAGFLGIPLMGLAFGSEAVGRIVVFDQVQSLGMFTLGIWIAAPDGEGRNIGGHLKSFIVEPLVWAILLGGMLRIADVSVPEPILKPIRYVGAAAAPLALVALGLRLAVTPLTFLKQFDTMKKMLWILGLRFGGGLLAGWIVCTGFGITGLNRNVVMIASALPSAVFSYILAERHNADPDLAAAAVFTSTILSLAVLPVLLSL